MKLSTEEIERYSRQIVLPGWGNETQGKLKSAKVLVIGAGGLGCSILQTLSLAGAGKLGLVDFDKISVSNLQRQVLYTSNDVGKLKTEVAKEKIKALNPFTEIEIFSQKLHKENVLSIISEYDLVIDGTDNFETRYLINDACVILHKPWIFGSIHQYEGQVSVFNYNNGPTYRCLFPEPPQRENAPDCNTAGVITSLPIIVGNIQANEAIKLLTQKGETLSGKLLSWNFLTNETYLLSIDPEPANKKITRLRDDYGFSCDIKNISGIPIEDIESARENYFLIDVRDETKHEKFNIGGDNIPLYQFDETNFQLPADKKIVTYCSTSNKAKNAALLLHTKYQREIYYLTTPLAALSKPE